MYNDKYVSEGEGGGNSDENEGGGGPIIIGLIHVALYVLIILLLEVIFRV